MRESDEEDYLLGTNRNRQPTKPTYTASSPTPTVSSGAVLEEYIDAGRRTPPPTVTPPVDNYIDPIQRQNPKPTTPTITEDYTAIERNRQAPKPYTPPKDDYVDAGRRTPTPPKPASPLDLAQKTYDTTASKFNEANSRLKTFITQADDIISTGTQDLYDWSQYEGGYSGFVNDYEQAKLDLQENTSIFAQYDQDYNYKIGVYKAQLNYINSTPSERQKELMSYSSMLSPEQVNALTAQAIAKDLVGEGVLKPIKVGRVVSRENAMKSSESLSTMDSGYQFTGDLAALNDSQLTRLKQIGFDIPTPEAPKEPTAWDNTVKLFEKEEEFFTNITSNIALIGSNAFKRTEELKAAGNPLAVLGFTTTAIIGGSAGVVDAATFLVRPLAFWRSAEAAAEFIHDPAGTVTTMQEQFSANPAYSMGYLTGTLLAPKIMGKIGGAAYNYGAPKIPLLRDFYYAGKFAKNAEYAEFRLPVDPAAGNALLGEAKAFFAGKPNYMFKEFRGTILNPATMPLRIGDVTLPSIAAVGQARAGYRFMRASTPTSSLGEFQGVLVNPATKPLTWGDFGIRAPSAGGYLDFFKYSKANNQYSPFRNTLVNPATRGLTLADMGLGGLGDFYKIRGGFSTYLSGKPNYMFKEFRGTLIDPATTPLDFTLGGSDALSRARGFLKFTKYATVIDDVVKPDTGLSGRVTTASGRSPNRGFSRMDSGVAGRVSTPFERDLEAFMKNNFRESTNFSESSGASVNVEIPKSAPASRSRGALPNPFYITRSDSGYITEEILYTGTSPPKSLVKTDLKGATLVISGLKPLTSTESKPKAKEKIDFTEISLLKPRARGKAELKLKPVSVTIEDVKIVPDTKPKPTLKQPTLQIPDFVIKQIIIPPPKIKDKTIPPPPTGGKPDKKRKGKRGKRGESLEVRLHAVQSAERVKKVLLKI